MAAGDKGGGGSGVRIEDQNEHAARRVDELQRRAAGVGARTGRIGRAGHEAEVAHDGLLQQQQPLRVAAAAVAAAAAAAAAVVVARRRHVQRDVNRGAQRVGLVRHGQRERIAQHGHQIDAAVLRLAVPVLKLLIS